MNCKHCKSTSHVKNGFVRGIQRYKCKECGLNFITQDARTNATVAAKKALCVLLYSLSKASFNMLGKILGHSPSLIYRWVRKEMDALPEPEIAGNIKEMAFDEMWHFVGSKKIKDRSSRPWIVAQGVLSPGWSVVVMLQPSSGFMIK